MDSFLGQFKILTTLIFLFAFSTRIVYSQDTETKLDELISEGNFGQAIVLGKILLEKQAHSPSLNFKTGYSFLNVPLKKDLALFYLTKADSIYSQISAQSPAALETRYHLGIAYHKNYQFDKAIGIFEKLKLQTKNKEMLIAIDEMIEQCNTGKRFISKPVKMLVTNLGNSINSEFADHSPVISADESILIFTSRRKIDENRMLNPDGQYNEDIYSSNLKEEGWSNPASLGANINTHAHEASIGLSADGQKLLIYSENEAGTILISNLRGDEWSVPVSVGENINTRFRETHASLSADGKFIYFTSDRPGGYGGLDIYVSELQSNRTWGKAQNLGPAVNTFRDEEGPFIHPDGITLYFSSKGHETMGGYDIFLSRKNEFGTWSLAENIGYPVNTTEDDVFFVMTADGKRAYFASYREEGLGGLDIYMMVLPEAEEIPLTVVKGLVQACVTDIDQVLIKVFENGSDVAQGIYKPNIKTGKYLFVLSRGKTYRANYQINGNTVHQEMFKIEENADFQILYRDIKLTGTVPCPEYVGRPEEDIEVQTSEYFMQNNENQDYTVVENIMFKVNTAEIGEFEKNVRKLADYLKKNNKINIEIIGYADTQGPESFNLRLAANRAKTVYKYLLSLGVGKDQISYTNGGISNQITINRYSDGSFVWQSLPYNRRVEFKVSSGQADKLKIVPFNIPKIYDVKREKLTREDYQELENRYTIQLAAFRKPINIDYFKGLKNVQMFYSGKYYHYTVGEFASEEEAAKILPEISGLGYSDAFIRSLAFYFPRKIQN